MHTQVIREITLTLRLVKMGIRYQLLERNQFKKW